MSQGTSHIDRLSGQHPWPGLRAFTEDDREFFFGRERETAELANLIQRASVVVLYGQSGLGKTSLLQAGLSPELKRLDLLPLRLRLSHDKTAPAFARQIMAALTTALDNAQIRAPRPDPNETLWEYFHRRDVDFWGPRNRLYTPVVVLDQFEEVFTLGQRDTATTARVEEFAAELEALLEHRPPEAIRRRLEADPDEALRFDLQRQAVKFVISLREDFLPHLDNWRTRMPSLLPHRLRLERMTGAQALQVVQRGGGGLVEPAVARSIVDFVSSSQRKRGETRALEERNVEPALLSVVCDELNRRRIERGKAQITADLLTGERESIIANFYERAYEGVDARVRDWVEDELLTASGYRDRAALEDAITAGLAESDFDRLVDRRILHREEREGVIWLELTHDLLTDPAARSRTAREQRQQTALAAERELELTGKTRRLKILCGALAAACVVIIGLVVQHWYNHSRPYVRYYSDYVKRWGIIHGVNPLDKAQIQHRRYSLRFIYAGRKGPLLSVQAVGSSGELTYRHDIGTYLNLSDQEENPNRECQWHFMPDAKGMIAYEMAYDKSTNFVWGLIYSPATAGKSQRFAHFVGPSGLPQPQKRSAADYVRIDYTDDGLEKMLSFWDRFGRQQTGPDKVYAKRTEYDKKGQAIKTECLDAHGRPMPDVDGVFAVAYKRDPAGNLVECTALDIDGKPMPFGNGNARWTARYDQWGNLTEVAYWDVAGNPTITKNGYARLVMGYDASGNRTEWACFDTDGKPTLSNYGYAKTVMRYDEKGNQTEWACFDASGNPTIQKNGYTKIIMRYDERGNEIENSFFDETGKLTFCKAGYAKVLMRYDERGNQTEWACFDTKNQPTLIQPSGHHGVKKVYDDRDNQIEIAYFDVTNRPVLVQNGYAKVLMRYDERGTEIERTYFDASNQPAIDNDSGTHSKQSVFDQQGNLIEQLYLDIDGNPTTCDNGYHKIKKRYDERGNEIEGACFDTMGRPIMTLTDGFHLVRKSYDARNNLIEEAYFDNNQRPISIKNGYARVVMRYDERGNQIEWACFDEQGKPSVVPKFANHLVRRRYDKKDRKIEESYYDASGRPVLSGGYFKMTASYDEKGNQVGWFCFDVEGKPAMAETGGDHGWRAYYDSRGSWTNWVYLDINSQPVIAKAGYARATAKYDDRRNEIEWACFDAQGKPILANDGYALVRSEYDVAGKFIDRRHFDANGSLIKPNVYVTEVLAGGQAEKIGLLANDVIHSYDGQEMSKTEEFFKAVRSEGKDPRELKILRGDKILSFTVRPGVLGIRIASKIIPAMTKSKE